jgi:hypothetical protein
MVALYTSLEDLIAENDRRCEDDSESESNSTYIVAFFFHGILDFFYHSDKIACSEATSHSRRLCRGCMIDLHNLTSTTLKIC